MIHKGVLCNPPDTSLLHHRRPFSPQGVAETEADKRKREKAEKKAGRPKMKTVH